MSRERGTSLIETLVALSLLGVALLLTMALLVQEPAARARLDAHGEALLLLDRELESARAGLWVPAVGEQTLEVELSEDSTLDLIEVKALRKERPRRGLAELTLTARYRVGGGVFERELKTMLFGY